MKKILALLMVLCIAASLFAIGSVKVGPQFNFVTGKTRDFKDANITNLESERKYKTTGFGFDISGRYDIYPDISAWADFNMTFCADGKYIKEGETKWTSIKDEYNDLKDYATNVKKKVNIVSISAGVAYKLPLRRSPIDVYVGGGVFLDRMLAEVSYYISKNYYATALKATNIGIAGYADAIYMFNPNFGVGLTLMPHIGLLNFTKLIVTYNKQAAESVSSGFTFSLSMPIVIGVTYAF